MRQLYRHTVLLLLFACSTFAAESATTQQLHQLFDREWEYQMSHNPVRASLLGDRRWNDKWSDLSLFAVQADYKHGREVLDDLHKIDRTQLSSDDQLNYDVFEYNLTDYTNGEPFKWYLVRTNTFSGIQTVEGLVNSLRFETVKDYDDWIARMGNFPVYMDQNIDLMREGIHQRILLPKVIGDKILGQLKEMDWQDPTRHGFYKPFKKMPATFSDIDKQRLQNSARQVIKTSVLPAFQKFQSF